MAALGQERCLIVLEPVDRTMANCTLGPHGRVFSADGQLAELFGYDNESDILGTKITDLIPAINLDKIVSSKGSFESRTGRTKCGLIFPLQLQISPTLDEESGEIMKYDLKMYILTVISGIVTVLANGEIHSCNRHFAWALMGKREDEVKGHRITTVLPEIVNTICPEDFIGDKEDSLAKEMAGLGLKDRLNRPNGLTEQHLSTLKDMNCPPQATSTPAHPPPAPPVKLLQIEKFISKAVEGTFNGSALHKDGGLINVGYQLRKLILKDGKILFCLWIFYKAEICTEPSGGILTTQNSSESESDFDADILKERRYSSDRRRSTSTAEMDMLKGHYSDAYDTMVQVGTGSFGAVRLASRKTDGLLVITKFIRKEKVLPDSWVEGKNGKKIPIEISLLNFLRHPNIVEVLDVFENDLYYQMVMSKHGNGMDLFDFIDRNPILDEPLMSYIFRQIVSAVRYLNSLSIVHRDIKDENVIIDENFKCKLIDFGSAAYYKVESVFSTFCGTVEYCSPEVLLGNKYVGPELEIWSLGILLYTLVYGENPFCTAQETIQAELSPPWDVSEGLEHLINWCLHPDPAIRATIHDLSEHWWVTQVVNSSKYKLENVLPSCEALELKPPVYAHELESCDLT